MAIEQIGPIVPGIPLAALDAITDANVRDVLRALVSTHHVRNNQAGAGDESFVTARQAALIANSTATAAVAAAFVPARYMRGVGDSTAYSSSVMSPAVGTINLTLVAATKFLATAIWQSIPVSGNYDTRAQVRLDGVAVLDQADSGLDGKTKSHMSQSTVEIGAGSHALTVHFANNNGGWFTLGPWSLLLLPVG